MNGSIGEERRRPVSCQGGADDVSDDHGLSHPAATCHTPRPSGGRDGDTSRLDHGRWCL